MKARRALCAALALVLATALFACGLKEFYSDSVENWRETVTASLAYHDHRHLPVTVLSDGVEYVSLETFPDMLDAICGGTVDRCVVGYGEDFPLGEHAQTLVSFSFSSPDAYGEAYSRLEGITPWFYDGEKLVNAESGEGTERELFDRPAFISVLDGFSAEYVLVDEERLTLSYVYLRDARDIGFGETFVPKGYDGGMKDQSAVIDIYSK